MKIFRTIACIFIIIVLIIVYSVSMTFIKGEDFIGSYYSINIESDILLEICGTSTAIIDKRSDEAIVCDVDSMITIDDAIYGISGNKYFLLTLLNGKVDYSSIAMSRYSKYTLLSPMEYYERKTKYIDIAGLIVLLCSITFVIKRVFLHDESRNHRDRLLILRK